MPTFILKKYQDKDPVEQPEVKPEDQQQDQSQEKTVSKEMTVEVTGSISEIVAQALNKVMVNKNIEMEEVESNDATVKAISTEDINSDPVAALESVVKADVLFISGNGFHTAKEEWFLTNIENKVGKVFYSVEAFVNFISSEFGNA